MSPAPSSPGGYAEKALNGIRVIARKDVLTFVETAISSAGSLYQYAAHHSERDTVRGRATAYTIPGPTGERWLVRHLSHGGFFARVTGDRFLWSRVPRPLNELQVALRLKEMGIPTPDVTAVAIHSALLYYRGDVARRWIPDARDLADCLFATPPLSESQRQAALEAAGRLVRALHDAGVFHPDLNLRNILIAWGDGPARAHILDLEKCRLKTRLGRGERKRMLRRLQRSLRKTERTAGRNLSSEERGTLFRAYDAAEERR